MKLASRLTKSYPAAEPEAPENTMVLCWCSRPARYSADVMPWRPRPHKTPAANTGKKKTTNAGNKRKMWSPVSTRAGELDADVRFGGSYSPSYCAHSEPGRGNQKAAEEWLLQVSINQKRWTMEWGFYLRARQYEQTQESKRRERRRRINFDRRNSRLVTHVISNRNFHPISYVIRIGSPYTSQNSHFNPL